MNLSKFSIADVVTVLSALLFGVICFLSTYFYTLGNTGQSFILATFITVFLGGTALGAKLLKRTSRRFKTCFTWEMILIFLNTVFIIFTAYSPFPHFFVVSEQRTEIQGKLSTNITQAENMFIEYEHYAFNRETLYKNHLESVVVAKAINPSEYLNYGFENSSISDDKQIENKMFTIHADLFPTNYSDSINKNGIKEVATKWLSDAKDKIAGGRPIGIVSVVNEIEQNSNDWLNKLTDLSAVREKEEQAENFAYHLSFDNVKKYFTTLNRPTPLSIGLSILAYLLMFFSWFITKRHTKKPQFRDIFCKSGGYIRKETDEVLL